MPREFGRDIRRLMDMNGGTALARQMVEQWAAQWAATIDDPELRAAFVFSDADYEELLEGLVPVYAEHYTHDEVRQLIEFYETPLGQKMVRATPSILGQAGDIGKSWALGAIWRRKWQKLAEPSEPREPQRRD